MHFHAGVAFQDKGLLQSKGDLQRKIIFREIPTNKTVNVDDLNVISPYNDGILFLWWKILPHWPARDFLEEEVGGLFAMIRLILKILR